MRPGHPKVTVRAHIFRAPPSTAASVLREIACPIGPTATSRRLIVCYSTPRPHLRTDVIRTARNTAEVQMGEIAA